MLGIFCCDKSYHVFSLDPVFMSTHTHTLTHPSHCLYSLLSWFLSVSELLQTFSAAVRSFRVLCCIANHGVGLKIRVFEYFVFFLYLFTFFVCILGVYTNSMFLQQHVGWWWCGFDCAYLGFVSLIVYLLCTILCFSSTFLCLIFSLLCEFECIKSQVKLFEYNLSNKWVRRIRDRFLFPVVIVVVAQNNLCW